MDAENLFRDALALAEPPDTNFLQLGRLLIDLRGSSPDRFHELIERSGLGRRKAYYLVTISEQLRELKERGTELDEAQLQRIGWTKLQVIAAGLTPRNAAKRLRMAERHTARQLTTRIQGNKPAPKEHAILLRLNREQYQVFEEAILQNGGTRKPTGRGLMNKEEALIRAIGGSRSPKKD